MRQTFQKITFSLSILVLGSLLHACYNSDSLDRLALKQELEVSFEIPEGQLPIRGIGMVSSKFENTTANLLKLNALETSDIASAVITSATFSVDAGNGTGLAIDSTQQVAFGIVRQPLDLLVTSSVNSIGISGNATIDLLQNNNSFKEHLFTTDSLQFVLILSLKDTLESALTPTVSLEYELRN